MIDCNSVSTPLVSGEKAQKTQDRNDDVKNKLPYQNLTGYLNYPAVSTKPHI